MKKKVLHIVGARPNFMKVAPIHAAIEAAGELEQILVHTGQHYDAKMSDVFFEALGLKEPDLHLGIGSGTHAEQTGRTLMALEKTFTEVKPDLVSVVGDVNGTLAGGLVGAKMGIPVSHVEAGLRSFDRSMPEEINRIVVDRIADLLLTPSPDADENLRREGVSEERIHFVGNVMIDSLLKARDKARERPTLAELGLEPGGYAVCTLHRQSNTDDRDVFEGLLDALVELSGAIPVVFPVHPRTRKTIAELGLQGRVESAPGLELLEPLGYLEFQCLTSQAKLVLTDSGGLQEETTALGIPCLTLRENTERPITVEQGTNLVVGVDPERVKAEARRILDGGGKAGRIPEKWDGKTAERIAALYAKFLR